MKWKSNPHYFCSQQWAIYSQHLKRDDAFHQNYKLTESSNQELPQPGVCGPVCHTSFPLSLHVCWQANDSGQAFTFTRQRLPAFFPSRSAGYRNLKPICVEDIFRRNDKKYVFVFCKKKHLFHTCRQVKQTFTVSWIHFHRLTHLLVQPHLWGWCAPPLRLDQ